MRTRLLTMLTALSVVALVVVAGYLTKVEVVEAKVPDSHDHAQSPASPQLADLLLRAITPAERPLQALPSTAFHGLSERIQQATTEAAGRGANLSIAVFDRGTRQLLSNGNTQSIATASVAKLFIADQLLLQESQGQATLSPEDHQALDVMLRSSDDGAAEQFWNKAGGNTIITQVASRYGLASTTPPNDGHWWNTASSAADLIRYYDMLLSGSGGLPPEQAALIIDDLAQSTPTGIDGYPQRFGIPDGLYGEPVAVKQGWMCCIGRNWMHLSTGVFGPEHRYIMVIESLQPTDEATARTTITDAVKTMFPDGRV